MTEHPQRLESFDYRGQHTYHLQFCTDDRQPLFTDRAAVELALSQFRRSASEQQFALLAYCFMPDHVHLVVQGASDAADLKAFASKAKQYSWYAYAQQTKNKLWQRCFYEHTLRSGELLESVICYVLMNPVRARLCATPQEYPFSGSEVYSRDELQEVFWSRNS